MKKIIKLTVLSALMVCGLASCGPKYVEKRSEEQIMNELANQAMAEVGVAYNSFASSGLAYGENELIINVNKKVWEEDKVGINFKFTYTLNYFFNEEHYDKEFVKLNDTGDKLVADLVTDLDLIEYPSSLSLGGAAYSLKGKIICLGYGENFVAPSGLTTTKNFDNKEMGTKNYRVVAKTTKSGTMHEIKSSAKADDNVLFYGQIVGYYNDSYDELYTGVFIGDGNDGIMIYAGTITKDFFDEDKNLRFDIGDYVQVYGTVSPYQGLFEVKPIQVVELTDPTIIALIEDPVYNEYSVEEFLKLSTVDTGKLCIVENLKLITNVTNMNPGSHLTIKACDADFVPEKEGDKAPELTLYLNYHYSAQKDALDFLKGLTEGQTFKAIGVVSSYSGAQYSPIILANDAPCFVLE